MNKNPLKQILNSFYLGFRCFFIVPVSFIFLLSLTFFNGSDFSKVFCFDTFEVRNLSIDSCFCLTDFFTRTVKSGSVPAKIVSKRTLLIPYFSKTLSYNENCILTRMYKCF